MLTSSSQIDTWNRNTSYGEPFKPGPESKRSGAPRTGPDAVYAGHLECPCTDRVIKTIKYTYSTTSSTQPACRTAVTSAEQCFDAVSQVGIVEGTVTKNSSVSSTSLPTGCSVYTSDGKSFVASFNAQTSSTAKCSVGGENLVVAGDARSVISFGVELNGAKDIATLTITGPSVGFVPPLSQRLRRGGSGPPRPRPYHGVCFLTCCGLLSRRRRCGLGWVWAPRS